MKLEDLQPDATVRGLLPAREGGIPKPEQGALFGEA